MFVVIVFLTLSPDRETYLISQTLEGPWREAARRSGEEPSCTRSFQEARHQNFGWGLYEKVESEGVLVVWARAEYLGWRNTVEKVTMRCATE